MKKAQKRDAVLNEKFEFRTGNPTCKAPPNEPNHRKDRIHEATVAHEEISLMSINEIINGDGDKFAGLVPLIKIYLDNADVDVDTRCTISQYLNFISKRASGEIMTLAHWTRDFVDKHEDYKHDSLVPDSTIYDLVKTMDSISRGDSHCERLLGRFRSKTDAAIPAAVRRAEANHAQSRHQAKKS